MAAGPLAVQHGVQGQGNIARGYLHGALRHAAPAPCAVLNLAPEIPEQDVIHMPLVDLRIVDGFHQHAVDHVLVAGMELQRQLGTGHGADRLALAAARAGLHVAQDVNKDVLVWQPALPDVADQRIEGEGKRLDRQFPVHKLGRIHHVAGIGPFLEEAQIVHLLLA